MKKLMALVLALALLLGIGGMAQAEEVFTSIPLGGTLGKYELKGRQFGKYVKTDEVPEQMQYDDDVQADFYVCEDAIVQYIAVYRWDNKKNQSVLEILEEEARAEQGLISDIQYFDEWGFAAGRFCGYKLGTTYYFDCYAALDGYDIVELTFYYACEEIPIIDGELYAYIPKGYSDLTRKGSDTEVLHVEYHFGKLPEIYEEIHPDTYADTARVFENCYGNAFAIDESQYSAWAQDGWTAAEREALVTALGGELLGYGNFMVGGLRVNYQIVCDSRYADEEYVYVIYRIPVGENVCEIWLTAIDGAMPFYSIGFANSLHTK